MIGVNNSHSEGVTNKFLFDECNHYVSNNFVSNSYRDITCLSYFVAIGQLTKSQCLLSQKGEESFHKSNFNAEKVDQYIVFYLNFIKKHPEYLKMSPALPVALSIDTLSPCS